MPPPARVTPRAGDTTPHGDDGVPYAEGSPARGRKKNKTDRINRGVGPTARPPAAVTGVDRSAGQGHWDTLLTSEFEMMMDDGCIFFIACSRMCVFVVGVGVRGV